MSLLLTVYIFHTWPAISVDFEHINVCWVVFFFFLVNDQDRNQWKVFFALGLVLGNFCSQQSHRIIEILHQKKQISLKFPAEWKKVGTNLQAKCSHKATVFCFFVNPLSANQTTQNGQTHSNNSSAVSRRIVLTILTGKSCGLLSSVQEWLLGCF